MRRSGRGVLEREVELLVLRHQLKVLTRGRRPPPFRRRDRMLLPTEPNDQTLDRRVQGRTTGRAGPGLAPPPREFSVPPEEPVGADQEAPPPVPGQQP